MPYIGFGCGAHSQLNHERFSNEYSITDYIKNPLGKEVIPLCQKDEISEFVFLGLRMTKGVDKLRFKELFGKSIDEIFKDEIKRHTKSGTLISDATSLRLTDRGIDVSNSVMADFILE